MVFFLLAAGATALLAEDDPYYPAAQCAAFWLGRDDYARASAYLDADPRDAARAAGFRAVAVRLNGGDATAIDAFIEAERGSMVLLLDAYIYGADEQSRELHDRLLQTCADYGASQAETRDLR